VLKSDGHSVNCVANVAAAMALAATHEFDFLLCDVGLPDGTGWDLMHALRLSGSKLPGIVVSGYGQEQDVEKSHQAGFATHLTKPLTLHKLREAIASLST
jgi:CheY-like chemotaxis protein